MLEIIVSRCLLRNKYWLSYKPAHHFAYSSGFIYEHRLVWEEANQACLMPWSHVHHINRITTDNRPENLQAMMNYEHWYMSKEKTILQQHQITKDGIDSMNDITQLLLELTS